MEQIAEIIKYEGDNSTFVWKHPSEDFNSLTQLIVHETQEAIFFMNGQALDLFSKAGRYTLETENIPKIGKILGRATGDRTPFHCEVYFVNKVEQMAVKWGTDSKVQYIDPTYGFPLSIGACGEMSLRVEDSRKLLVKIVGTESYLSQAKLVEFFRAFLMTRVKTYIAQMMKAKEVNIFEIDANLMSFSDDLRAQLIPDFAEYGVALEKFFVTSVLKPDGDPQYEKFKELHFRQYADITETNLKNRVMIMDATAGAQKAVIESQARATSRAQEGYTKQWEDTAKIMDDLAKNEGSGSDLRNAAMGLGVGFGAGAPLGSAMQQLASTTMNGMFAQPSQLVPQEQKGSMPGMVNLKEEVSPESESGPISSDMDTFKERIEKLKMMRDILPEEEYQAKLQELKDSI